MPDTISKLPYDGNWHKELYYDTKFQISGLPEPKYMSMLHLDSNLMICHILANLVKNETRRATLTDLLDHRT